MNKMNYRIALQSKKMLTDALIKLMATDDYSKITITQICKEADLSRRTFYRLYKTKEDILNEYMALLTTSFLEKIKESKPKHYPEVAAVYFSFWQEHIDFLKLLKRNMLLDTLYNMAKKVAPSIFQIVKPTIKSNEKILEFALSYSIGGLYGMLIRWVEGDMKPSPEELTDILKQTINIAAL